MNILRTFRIKQSAPQINPIQTVELPKGAKIIGCKDDILHSIIYCLVDEFETETEEYNIKWIQDGERLSDNYQFIGTSSKTDACLFDMGQKGTILSLN